MPSDLPPVIVPERFNAAAFFLDPHIAEGRGGRTAFRFAGRAVTYGEVGRRANQLGSALRARGAVIEQRVLLALPDRPEFAEAFCGARWIDFAADLPRTSTGKIQRLRLRG